MADSVSKQIADVQQSVMKLAGSGITGKDATFKLGVIYSELDNIKRAAIEQETAYSHMCKVFFAKNPSKMRGILQNLADIVSGKGLEEAETSDTDRVNVKKS